MTIVTASLEETKICIHLTSITNGSDIRVQLQSVGTFLDICSFFSVPKQAVWNEDFKNLFFPLLNGKCWVIYFKDAMKVTTHERQNGGMQQYYPAPKNRT